MYLTCTNQMAHYISRGLQRWSRVRTLYTSHVCTHSESSSVGLFSLYINGIMLGICPDLGFLFCFVLILEVFFFFKHGLCRPISLIMDFFKHTFQLLLELSQEYSKHIFNSGCNKKLKEFRVWVAHLYRPHLVALGG